LRDKRDEKFGLKKLSAKLHLPLNTGRSFRKRPESTITTMTMTITTKHAGKAM